MRKEKVEEVKSANTELPDIYKVRAIKGKIKTFVIEMTSFKKSKSRVPISVLARCFK